MIHPTSHPSPQPPTEHPRQTNAPPPEPSPVFGALIDRANARRTTAGPTPHEVSAKHSPRSSSRPPLDPHAATDPKAAEAASPNPPLTHDEPSRIDVDEDDAPETPQSDPYTPLSPSHTQADPPNNSHGLAAEASDLQPTPPGAGTDQTPHQHATTSQDRSPGSLSNSLIQNSFVDTQQGWRTSPIHNGVDQTNGVVRANGVNLADGVDLADGVYPADGIDLVDGVFDGVEFSGEAVSFVSDVNKAPTDRRSPSATGRAEEAAWRAWMDRLTGASAAGAGAAEGATGETMTGQQAVASSLEQLGRGVGIEGALEGAVQNGEGQSGIGFEGAARSVDVGGEMKALVETPGRQGVMAEVIRDIARAQVKVGEAGATAEVEVLVEGEMVKIKVRISGDRVNVEVRGLDAASLARLRQSLQPELERHQLHMGQVSEDLQGGDGRGRGQRSPVQEDEEDGLSARGVRRAGAARVEELEHRDQERPRPREVVGPDRIWVAA